MKNSNFTFTITSTDRCNAACTYCHYYSAGGKAAKRVGGTSRGLFRSDIDNETIEAYFSFIAYFKQKYQNSNVFYRFSGGDPMVLGDRLFTIAARGTKLLVQSPICLQLVKLSPKNGLKKQKNQP